MRTISKEINDFMVDVIKSFNVNTKTPYIVLQSKSSDIEYLYYEEKNKEIALLDISETIIENSDIVNVYVVETTFLERYDNGKYNSPQPCLVIQVINQDQVVVALATYMQNGNKIIYDKITTHFLNKTEQSLGVYFALYNAFLIRNGL